MTSKWNKSYRTIKEAQEEFNFNLLVDGFLLSLCLLAVLFCDPIVNYIFKV